MKTIYKKPHRILLAAIAVAAFGMGATSASASSYYLKIGEIQGESTDRNHRDWIDVDTFYWGITSSATVGGGRRGSAVGSPLSWTQGMDSSVPTQFVGVASGKHYQSATLEASATYSDAGRVVYFQMLFENVVLTSLNLSGTGDAILAAGSLVYDKLTMTYRPLDNRGGLGSPVIGVWDFSDGAAATFSGSPEVLEGLFLAGPTAVPAPAAVWLLGTGVLGLAGFKRWRRPVPRSRAN